MKALIAVTTTVLVLAAAVLPASAWVNGQTHCWVVNGQKFCSR
jgi:hypothetical protein